MQILLIAAMLCICVVNLRIVQAKQKELEEYKHKNEELNKACDWYATNIDEMLTEKEKYIKYLFKVMQKKAKATKLISNLKKKLEIEKQKSFKANNNYLAILNVNRELREINKKLIIFKNAVEAGRKDSE